MRVRLDRKSQQLLKAFNLLRRDGDAGDLPRTKFDYGKDVGDGLRSAVIVATALWISRNFTEAPVVVRDPDGEIESDHELAKLLKYPNPYYSGGSLRAAVGLDYGVQGNAYIEIGERGRGGRPESLYYQPTTQITPKGTSDKLITHYEHATERGPRTIPVEDMIHIRYGLDPRNQRLGFNPLQALLREVFTDDEAANFTAAVLRNYGFPGIIAMPREAGDTIGEKARDLFKKYLRRAFGGDNRGEPLVLDGQLKIETLEADLSKLNIDKLRQIPEERVTAVMGVPAAVVGFGTGLEQTKVGATMSSMRKMAYENAIIPMQRIFAEELTAALLPEFDTREDAAVVFDLRDVRILQEDADSRSNRTIKEYNAGLITRAEGRTRLGHEAGPGDDVYKIGFSDKFTTSGRKNWIADTLRKALPAKDAAFDRRADLIKKLDADRDRLVPIWADELKKEFRRIADDIVRLWELEQIQVASGNGNGQHKQVSEADRELIDRILLAYKIPPLVYETHYLRVLKQTLETINAVMGLAVMLSEPMEQEIIALGGTRKGLVDLTEQTRSAMYESVAEARAEGEGVRATANRIRDGIEAGPWNSVEYRSEIIARTETRYAQNRSALSVYDEADTVEAVQAFDAQLGPTDEVCMARNGQIMSTIEARSELEEEHPNGTLDFAPVIAER